MSSNILNFNSSLIDSHIDKIQKNKLIENKDGIKLQD